MTRFEFTIKLRKALSGRVNHVIVNDNVAYYENYIDAEMKKGRKEKEILEELGDPRLIAKQLSIPRKKATEILPMKKKERFQTDFLAADLPGFLPGCFGLYFFLFL